MLMNPSVVCCAQFASWLQYALTPALANAVLTKVATYVAKQLEPRIRRKRINHLGGIQFDSDMRTLAAFFAARCGRRVRSRFVRLLQTAQLLTFESPSEVLEYWGPNAGVVPWELSAEEVRSTLSLRVEFSAQDIARLRL
jgi:conserved oligomeric Golgi complex subunit 4